jgi:hypothetical protein
VSSRTTADLLVAAALGAVAYLVVRTPPLRRAAWRAVRTGLTVTLPGYVMHELRDAWRASAERP